MRRRGLRLPLVRKPDPVLTPDELDWVAAVARDRVQEHARIMAKGKVSEAVIRSRMSGDDVLAKLYEAGAWRPKDDRYEPYE